MTTITSLETHDGVTMRIEYRSSILDRHGNRTRARAAIPSGTWKTRRGVETVAAASHVVYRGGERLRFPPGGERQGCTRPADQ